MNIYTSILIKCNITTTPYVQHCLHIAIYMHIKLPAFVDITWQGVTNMRYYGL